VQFFQIGDSVLHLPVSTGQSRRHQCLKILRYPVSGFCNPAFIKGPDGSRGRPSYRAGAIAGMAEQPNGGIELRDLRKIEQDGFLHPAACTPQSPSNSRCISRGRLHDDHRKLAPACRRSDRIHDATAADGGLGASAVLSPSQLSGSDATCTFLRSARPKNPNTNSKAPTAISQCGNSIAGFPFELARRTT
jgi:hypothetical protein